MAKQQSQFGNPANFNTTPATRTDGDPSALEVNSTGSLLVTLATLIAGEDLTNNVTKVEQRFSYNNITTATTTTVKSAAGFLHCITINAAAASATVTIYDNTAGSGTKIGTITMPATLLANQDELIYNVSFNTGLTIVTTGTQDITVSYR